MPLVLHLKENITKFARFQYTNIIYFDFQYDPICRATVERENNLKGRCLDSLCCMLHEILVNGRTNIKAKKDYRFSLSRSGHSDQVNRRQEILAHPLHMKPALLLHNNYRLPTYTPQQWWSTNISLLYFYVSIGCWTTTNYPPFLQVLLKMCQNFNGCK